MQSLLRHVAACNNAVLPGTRLPLCLAGAPIGWLRPELAASLAGWPGLRRSDAGLDLAEPARLTLLGRELAEAGHCRWRGEAFDVRATVGGAVLAQIDRGALPVLGLIAVGVHVNGLVQRPDGAWLWVGVRAADKHLDPGKLDHLVAGGVAAGMTPQQTLIKEAAEEAAVPAALAARAVASGRLGYVMERPEGLRRDLLLCYDLDLPETFVPRPTDGEVARFERWPLTEVLATVRAGDAFKFNVNLVLIDLFLRLGLIVGTEASALRAALAAPAFGAPT